MTSGTELAMMPDADAYLTVSGIPVLTSYVQGLFLSTAASVDVQRVSLPITLSVYMQGVHYHQYSFFKCQTFRHPVNPVSE